MLSFEKTVNDEQQNLIDDKCEDVDKNQSGKEDGYKYSLPVLRLNASE